MTKSELRRIYKEKRKLLTSTEIDAQSILILENLKSLPIWGNTVFHVFVSIKHQNEINTFPLMDYLFQQNKRVVVPQTSGDHMISCEIQPDVLWETGNFNVPEPLKFMEINPKLIQVIFVPLFICDLKGNRIGYGGGFYDRFFEKTNPNIIKIGINFFEPINEIIESEPFDIPLDYCVTPKSIVSFTS